MMKQNKIAQRMAETNLSLQEQLAAREIATALSPNSSNRQSSQFHDEAPATNSSRNDAEQTTASGSYLQGRFNSPYSYSMAVPRSNGGKELSSEPIVGKTIVSCTKLFCIDLLFCFQTTG